MNRSEIAALDDLRAFEAVARLGSVRSAADEMALTHGAVSRRITKLAQDLGFALFEKSGRGLRLTVSGETLYLSVNRCFSELASTIADLKARHSRHDALVLSCEPSVAMRWLIPRLSGFHAINPGTTLHLSVGGGPVEFRRDRIDLAIRRLDFAVPEAWSVDHLMAERVGPVMIPELVDGFRGGDYVALGSKTRPDAWSRWLAEHPACPAPKEIRFFDHHFLIVEAALAGLGVALSPHVLAVDDIARKRLCAPVGFHADGSHYGLIWSGRDAIAPCAAILSSWLKTEIAKGLGHYSS